MENKSYIGIVDDPRSRFEQEKDWQKVELVGAGLPASIKWIAKARPAAGSQVFDLNDVTWRKFPNRDQDGSSTCVMQTAAKLGGIDNYNEEGEFVVLSAAFGYSYRINKSWGTGEGMTALDTPTILKERGLCLEVQAPSQRLSEAQINEYKPKVSHVEVARIFRIKNDVILDWNNIDQIAAAISTGKGVMLWFKADKREWTDVPFLSASPVFDLSHSVAAVDYILWNGEKAIVIEDSWGDTFGLDGQRIITESFLRSRCFLAKEFVDLKNDFRDEDGFTSPEFTDEKKPLYTFNKNLSFSPVYNVDEDVKALQRILRYEGFFPTHLDGKPLEVTGYYGAVTARAVRQWQEKHKVASPIEIADLAGRQVGPKSRKLLNDLY